MLFYKIYIQFVTCDSLGFDPRFQNWETNMSNTIRAGFVTLLTKLS